MLLPLRIAIAFLTIVPISLPEQLSAGQLARSTAFFPLAGWLMGGFLASACWLFLLMPLPPLVAAVLLVALAAWLSRGLHLDGLADLADGLGGSHEPGKRLAIMKDSATGAFGVIALVLLLAFKIACLAVLFDLGGEPLFLALLAAPVMARWAMASLAFRAKYPRESGTGHSFVGRVRGQDLFLAGLFLLPVLWWHWQAGLLIFVAALVPSFLLRLKATKALGGITGDVLGAACELSEACSLLAVLVFFF